MRPGTHVARQNKFVALQELLTHLLSELAVRHHLNACDIHPNLSLRQGTTWTIWFWKSYSIIFWKEMELVLFNTLTQKVYYNLMSIVGSVEASSKAFLLFFLLPDWLKLNRLRSWMECGFSDIFSRHICSTIAETIGVTNNAASFGAKKCSENHIWSCWDYARSVEPTINTFRAVSVLFVSCDIKIFEDLITLMGMQSSTN